MHVKVCCLARTIYMGIESQRIVNNDAETLDAVRLTNYGVSDCDEIKWAFRSLPSAGSYDNCFSLVRIERQAVQKKPVIDVLQHFDSDGSTFSSFNAM